MATMGLITAAPGRELLLLMAVVMGHFLSIMLLMNNPPPIVHVAQRSPGIHQKRNLTQVTFI